MNILCYKAIIIGSGVAAYSAADRLHDAGITDIAVVTDNRLFGTSRNAGSDKQTYYKMAADGVTRDSAFDMAKAIAAGGSTDGELAYIEAQNSLMCFYRLIELGVDFPRDSYGGYPAYVTDHDTFARATSLGPYTSKKMTECLERKVVDVDKTPILEGFTVFKIVVEKNTAKGIIAFDEKQNKHIFIEAQNIIVCTGAPASVYCNSVYPPSQKGMTGMLIDCGAMLANFDEWQFGIASTQIKWNLSGSYMQVIPRFITVDSYGRESEFLRGSLSDDEIIEYTFLKGYEWPFDVEKLERSSKIDYLVQKATNSGLNVKLDFTKNPTGFDLDSLPKCAKDYLQKSDAFDNLPYTRLIALNRRAYDFYMSHGEDLSKNPIDIAVCAQHNNGGVWVDKNWQTSVKGLFVSGEVAGTFGVTRPGGSALNAAMVGGVRIAEYLAQSSSNGQIADIEGVLGQLSALDKDALDFCPALPEYDEIPRLMDKYFGAVKYVDKAKEILSRIGKIRNNGIKANTYVEKLRAEDMLKSAEALIKCYVEASNTGASRGSALYIKSNKIISENRIYRKYIRVLKNNGFDYELCKPVPKPQNWFEKTYNKREIKEH